jgi:competence protein ComFC
MFNVLLDLIFPRMSLTGECGDFVTEKELVRLSMAPVRMSIVGLDHVVAMGTYAGAPLLRQAIYTMKYGRVEDIARRLGQLLSDNFALLNVTKESVICPVPLHWSREFYRGFNAKTGIPFKKLLKRTRPTGYQARRTRHERKRAVSEAFAMRFVNISSHQHNSIILIDDVSTTGATLSECARVLRCHGAKKVYGLVIAQG